MGTTAQSASQRSVEVFVDESGLDLPSGHHALIYAAVVPERLDEAEREVAELKRSFQLPPDGEIKWNSAGGDPPRKAAIKHAFLCVAARYCRAFISVTKGTDKDTAFLNCLRQIADYAREGRIPSVWVHHDEGAFSDHSLMLAETASWKDVACSGLVQEQSHLSLPVQFADMIAGTCHYRLARHFGTRAKVVSSYDESIESDVVLDLDEMFRIILRFTMWGGTPIKPWDGEGEFDPLYATCDFFGRGIRAHGDFTEDEVKALRCISLHYLGCMH